MKIRNFLFLSLTAAILVELNAQNPSYPNQITLQEPDLALLYWTQNDTDITFEINYKMTSRWILFGLNNAKTNQSDVVVAWVNDDGTGYFADGNLNSQNVLSVDSTQNWFVSDAYTKNNFRVLTFSRKVRICDPTNQDLDILTGNGNSIVFAQGQLADDMTGKLGDFQSSSINYVNRSIVLLTQSKGPFNCFIPPSPAIFNSTPTGFYSNNVDLIDAVYRLYWNYTATDLVGEIHVKTNGWVGFGLSPNGGMNGSDVFVAWINNDGSVNFTV